MITLLHTVYYFLNVLCNVPTLTNSQRHSDIAKYIPKDCAIGTYTHNTQEEDGILGGNPTSNLNVPRTTD